MSDSKTSIRFPVASVLGLIFITLKLTGYITWPWVWVLAPFWIPVALIVLIFIGAGIYAINLKNKEGS